jgi:hypothetical protein
MSETEDPGYSERDDDDFSPPTGDGVDPDPAELDLEELEDDDGNEGEEDL